jgi:tetratricopeptide (TPR) repeat protein
MTVRDGAPGAGDLSFLEGNVRRLPVARLPLEKACELATLLLRRLGIDAEQEATAIGLGAGGHPMFIDELARHFGTPTGERGRHAQLDDALWARIQRFSPSVTHVLELVAVSGGPTPLKALACAAGGMTLLRPALAALRGGNLVRSVGDAETFEPYHDRVREAVLAKLDPESARARHEELARALEATGSADHQALSVHWWEAGDLQRASDYAAQAADEAARTLAFDRAARLYQMSLDLFPVAEVVRRERSVKLGDALSGAGRGQDAAAAYLLAAQLATPDDALRLVHRAAEQLLVSGRIDEGLAAMQSVLAAHRLPLRTTPRRALTSLVLRRAQVRLRGLRFTERAEHDIPVKELARIDVCWSMASNLMLVDVMRGSEFQSRHLLYALRAGEPHRVVRAVAMEAAVAASGGDLVRSGELLAMAEALARRLDTPDAHAHVRTARGAILFLAGRWAEARTECEAAVELLRVCGADASWALKLSQQFALFALTMTGELGELSRRLVQLRRSAQDRGDLFASLSLRTGLLTLGSLLADEPDRALQEVDEVLAGWSQEGFHLQHFWALYGRMFCDLYLGEGRRALARLEAVRHDIESSLMMRVESIRTSLYDLHGRSALLVASTLAPFDPARERLLATAEHNAVLLTRERIAWAAPNAALLRSGIAAVRRDRPRAIALMQEAETLFSGVRMPWHVVVARRRLGELRGDVRLVAACDAWMETQEVRNPARLAGMIVLPIDPG